MGSSKPKPVQAPFQQQQQQTNTYDRFSVADSPEARDLLSTPLDFGDPVDVDPGVGRRTDLAEQEAENEADSAFNAGVPRWLRRGALANTQRGIRAQGAYEGQQARSINQQANNAIRERRTMAELERRRLLLPQILQTGGSGSTSGFNTQIVQPQPGFWQRAALSAIGGASSALRFGVGG